MRKIVKIFIFIPIVIIFIYLSPIILILGFIFITFYIVGNLLFNKIPLLLGAEPLFPDSCAILHRKGYLWVNDEFACRISNVCSLNSLKRLPHYEEVALTTEYKDSDANSLLYLLHVLEKQREPGRVENVGKRPPPRAPGWTGGDISVASARRSGPKKDFPPRDAV
jgi:hypothetical protein